MKGQFLILAVAGCVFAQVPVRVDDAEASSHQRASISFIRVPKPQGPGSMPFEVRVNKLGEIVEVKPIPGGRAEYFEAAEKVVRSWRYEPFLRDGQPVDAIAWAWVFVLPPEVRPVVHRPFPEVQDWNTVRIKLIRTGCFGSCPSYEVEIRGDGVVTYVGNRDVAVTGSHKGSVGRPSIEALIARFREADFFSFDAKYESSISDSATYTTSVTIDGQAHTVKDYVGAQVGMPLVIAELEGAIDAYSGVDKWVRGNGDTVSALRAEGFDFGSQEAGRVLAYAAGRGNADAVRGLILAGAPLDVPGSGMFFVEKPLRAAARNRDPEVMRLLIEAGASRNDQ